MNYSPQKTRIYGVSVEHTSLTDDISTNINSFILKIEVIVKMITKFYKNRRFLDGLFEYMVPKGHRIREIFDSLDFSFVDEICDKYYKNQNTGRPAESPERIIRMFFILFYEGITSETKLVERLSTDVSYRLFCKFHMDEKIPDHSTLWAFRKRLGSEGFQEIFERILLQCIDQGLVDGRRFMFDCTNTNAKGTPYSKYQQSLILSKALLEYLESSHASTTGGEEKRYSPEFLKLVSQVASQASGYKRPETIERKLGESLNPADKETPGDEPGPSPPPPSGENENSQKCDNSSDSDNPDNNPDNNPGGGNPVEPEICNIKGNNFNTCDLCNSGNPCDPCDPGDNPNNPDNPDNNPGGGSPVNLPDKENLKVVAEKLRKTLPHTAGDSDARTGHTSNKKTFTGYLDGVMTDDLHQVVLSVKIYPGNKRQSDTVIDAMEYYAQNIAPRISSVENPEIVMDSAFDYPEVYEASGKFGLNAVTSLRKRPSKKEKYDTDYFKMDENELLRCPANRIMLRSGKPDDKGRYAYRGGKMCKNCHLQKSCTASNKGRTVLLNPAAKLNRQRQLKKAQADEYRKTLRQRMVIEGVFGNGKTYHNLGRALYRSAGMVKIQILLWALVHNSLKAFRYGSSAGSMPVKVCKSSSFLELELDFAA